MFWDILGSIIFGGLYLKQRAEKSAANNEQSKYDMRKTFSKIERNKICDYVEQGCSLEEACDIAADEMIALGFYPCVQPKNFKYYKPGDDINKFRQTTLWSGEDSLFIRMSHNLYDDYKKDHPILNLPELTPEVMYANMPESIYEFEKFKDTYYDYHITYRIGNTVLIPGYGCCKITNKYYVEKFGIIKKLFGVIPIPANVYYDFTILKDGKKSSINAKTKGIVLV